MRVNPFTDRSRTKFWATLTGLLIASTRLAQAYPDPRVQALGTALQPFFDGATTITVPATVIRMRDGIAK